MSRNTTNSMVWVVLATRVVASERLHAQDRAVPRAVVVEGDDPDEVLDRYHRVVPVKCLDHFQFEVMPAEAYPRLREPEDDNTNIGFLVRLMRHSRYGVLMQAFIMERLQHVAEVTVANKDALLKCDTHFINPTAWVGCAEEFLEEHKKTFGHGFSG